MKTTSKNGVRKFEFSQLERDRTDFVLTLLDDMKRYPEEFCDADESLMLLEGLREKMGEPSKRTLAAAADLASDPLAYAEAGKPAADTKDEKKTPK